MDASTITPAEVIPASRKLGKKDAERLLKDAAKLFVAKGGKVAEFAGGRADAAAVAAMLGPTGNLRAPAIRIGTTLIVGFDEGVFRKILG